MPPDAIWLQHLFYRQQKTLDIFHVTTASQLSFLPFHGVLACPSQLLLIYLKATTYLLTHSLKMCRVIVVMRQQFADDPAHNWDYFV